MILATAYPYVVGIRCNIADILNVSEWIEENCADPYLMFSNQRFFTFGERTAAQQGRMISFMTPESNVQQVIYMFSSSVDAVATKLRWADNILNPYEQDMFAHMVTPV